MGMDKIIVTGGRPLCGVIPISGAKNAALPLICASLLTEQSVTLTNIPLLRDIHSTYALIRELGVVVTQNTQKSAPQFGHSFTFNAKNIASFTAPYDLVRQMRASILVLGPLVARFGEARVSLPGGCAIGTRPVDLHIYGLECLGAKIRLEEGYIIAEAKAGLKGASVHFEKVSVGATENIMMAASLAKGRTVMTNAAREPEIVDLGECLIKMGAKISGLGTDTITIDGVPTLNGCEHQVMPDRIETGTYMIAAMMTGGDVTLTNTRADFLDALIKLLYTVGADIIVGNDNSIRIKRSGSVLNSVDILTAPHPGFPTDLQAQMMALLTICQGAGMVTETIFENRFMHVPELCRMGANITVHHASALIRGVTALKGADVMATDLRASVSLILAGLVAEGKTTLHRTYHLDRGYEDLVGKLKAVGAQIERVADEQEAAQSSAQSKRALLD
jgi:UDP-N-acetylglucosamine 1-carboxyvinyltransferase